MALLLCIAAVASTTALNTAVCNETDNRILGAGSITTIKHVPSSLACCTHCQSEPRCVAYTWVKQGAKSPQVCYLKDNARDTGADNHTTSGVCRTVPAPPAPPPPPSPPAPTGPCLPPPSKPFPPAQKLPRCSEFPDPWLKSDGTRVKTGAEWTVHRADMLAMIEYYMMGASPPRPPVCSTVNGTYDVHELCDRTGCVKAEATLTNLTLHVGPNSTHTQPFDVFVYFPKATANATATATAAGAGSVAKKKYPIFVYNGEGFYSGVGFGDLTAAGLKLLLDRGYAVANFDRNQLRIDQKTGPTGGSANGVQLLYPDHDWGTLAVWAWGAANVVDFLLENVTMASMIDSDKIMSIGHSRGGKTALWHAAQDERVSITFPLMSGTCGNGPLDRVVSPWPTGPIPPGADCRVRYPGPCSQTVADIVFHFPYWFTPRFANFSNDNSDRAPWDQHWQKMLVAPRAQLGVEGISNQHENPVGSQATYIATQTIYDWLGVPNKLGTFFHPGAHPMNDVPGEHDWQVVADFADLIHFGQQPTNSSLFNTTAYTIQKPFSWKAPTTPP